MSKIHIINITIVFLWTLFLCLNWITYFRLIIFLTVLGIIFIYKYLINKLEKTVYSIQNSNILKIIVMINKYRNPVLLFLIKWDILMYDTIIYYNNKILNFVIYILYILIINPIKIFHFKLYKILYIWKSSKISNILLNRMVGLILSVLVFTDVIIYIKNALNVNIFIIIYLYCLVISLLCELIETRCNKWLNIILVNNIDSKSIIRNRLEVNILSIILKKSNIDENSLYIDENKKIEAFQIGYTYYIIESLKYFESKPNYWLYIKLITCLDLCFKRVDSYIFFSYYDWNVPNMYLIEDFNLKDLPKLKLMYEYDYKVFKTLLYLYWDLEYYLEGADYVKNTLIVDTGNLKFLNIKFRNNIKSEFQFLDKIKYKDANKFFEQNDFIKQFVHQLDLWDYKYLNLSDICTLKEVCDPINPSYYSNYIEMWYKEWKSELNQDLSIKYQDKIDLLNQNQ